ARLPDADEDPRDVKDILVRRQAAGDGRHAPDDDAEGKKPGAPKAVRHQTDGDGADHVADREKRPEPTELLIAESHSTFLHRRLEGIFEGADELAVKVVEEVGGKDDRESPECESASNHEARPVRSPRESVPGTAPRPLHCGRRS